MLLGGAVASLISSCCAALGSTIALRKFLRAGREIHWTERARLAFPARSAIISNAVLLPLAFGALGGLVVASRLGLPGRPVGFVWAILAWAGVRLHGRRLERRLFPRGAAPAEARRTITLPMFLFGPILAVWGMILALIPVHWGPAALAVLAAGVTALFLLNIRGGWLAPCRRLGLLHPATPRLLAVVERASTLTAIPAQGVELLRSGASNAFAFPFLGRLVFTDPVLNVLDDDELAAIAVHELAHLDEPWAVKITRSSGLLILPCLAAIVPLAGSFGLLAALIVPAVLLVVLVVNRVARLMEVRSDRLGHRYEGDAGTYARALEKICEANLFPAVLKAKEPIHPHLYDRMIAAGVQPSYDRPAPPRESMLAGLPTIALLTIVATTITLKATILAPSSPPQDDLNPRAATALADAAGERLGAGDLQGAENLYRRAVVLDPSSPAHPARLAMLLASRGRCDEAGQQLDIARSRPAVVADRVGSDTQSLLDLAVSTVGRCQPAAPADRPLRREQ